MILQIVLIVISALLIAAHYLRQGEYLLVAGCLLFPLFLLVKRQWALVLVQVCAYIAAALWVHVAMQIIRERIAMGRPYRAVIVILGSVSLFTILSGILLNTKSAKERYPS